MLVKANYKSTVSQLHEKKLLKMTKNIEQVLGDWCFERSGSLLKVFPTGKEVSMFVSM